MAKYYSDTNIYNEEGLLLLAKGQELTNELRIKLSKLGLQEKTDVAQVHDEINISGYVGNLKEELIGFDEDLINDSSKILMDILFTKSNSWWIHINALSNYVDWVYTHAINVALISLIIAIKLNYSKEKLKILCLGALLHDVGKLLIPKDILQKSKKLSDQETTLIKQHCELGCSMIKDLDLSPEITNVILQHHERLDGSGYPYGLHSNQISDNAQIVIIADILDSITSYRRHENSRTINVAIKELKKDESKYSSYILEVLENCLNT